MGIWKSFFENENQGYSPSISDNGKLKSGNKADLLGLLAALVSSHNIGSSPTVDAIALEGATIVNMLPTGNARTFSDYADPPPAQNDWSLCHESDEACQQGRCCVGYIFFWQFEGWDPKERRSKQIRRRVEKSSPIPGNWKDFLLISGNKTELFSFLASNVTAILTDNQIVSTYHEEILCTQPRDVWGLLHVHRKRPIQE